jgi:hypothetical protein
LQVDKSRRHNLRERFERFLSGRPPADPLYLTNRSWKQKLLLGALIAVPVVFLAGLVMVGSRDMLRWNRADPYQPPLAATPAAAPAPQHLPDFRATPAPLEVLNIRIHPDAVPPAVTGLVRNNTSREIGPVTVTYYLANQEGSLMGTESTNLRKVGPHETIPFRAPVKMARARFVAVREVRAE